MGLVSETLLDDLFDAGVIFEDGLSDDELTDVEQRFGITLCADHRDLLSRVLPVGRGWPDWVAEDDGPVREALAAPVDGVLFDVQNNGFWPASWGPGRPDETIARAQLARVPRLVPVYGHRYLPSGPAPAGTPVLSVHQTDVIYYGIDLADYLAREFLHRGARMPAVPTELRTPFWSDLVDGTL